MIKSVVIIDYGLGNTGSILNMLKKIGIRSELSATPQRISSATHLILPGVGAFDTAMEKLRSSNLIPVLEDCVFQKRTPILGVCLGMQVLGLRSDEGSLDGLGWLDAYSTRFDSSAAPEKIRIPHMGWNEIQVVNPSPLTTGLEAESKFYFVHSFHMQCNNTNNIMCTTNYGYPFVSAVRSQNIFGVQFHPEKSHRFGLHLLKNFVEI